MKKFLFFAFMYIAFPISVYSAQYNGNVINNTDQSISVTGYSSYGNWTGPNPQGNFILDSYSGAGFSQTSDEGRIDTTITIKAGNTLICSFHLQYDNSGYNSWNDGDRCKISPINNCTSCLNLEVN